MAIVSSLARAMRELAERAIVHTRPPEPLKPQARSLSYHHSTQASASHYATPIFPATSPLSATPAAQTLSSARDALRMFFDHAISPVFIGLRAPQSAHVDKLYKSSAQSQFYQMTRSRPFKPSLFRTGCRPKSSGRQKTASDEPTSHIFNLVKNNEASSSKFNAPAELVFAPSLGLRAAVDELEDQLRGLDGIQKGKQREASPLLRQVNNEDAFGSKRKSWNVAQYIKDLDNTCAPSPTISIISLSDIGNDDPSDCSSSELEYLEEQAHALQAARNESLYFRPGDLQRGKVDVDSSRRAGVYMQTILELPLEPHRPPDESDGMAESTTCGSSSLLEGVFEQIEAHRHHDRQLINALDHAMHQGYLSKLEPQGWDDGGAFSRINEGGRHNLAFMPITFYNCNADEVNEALRLDLSPQLYSRLVDCVKEYRVDCDGHLIDTPYL